jgi:hypothetical protein
MNTDIVDAGARSVTPSHVPSVFIRVHPWFQSLVPEQSSDWNDRETWPMTDEKPPEDLSHAGAVVDKAIEYMIGQNISAVSIASALLGGAMALLARSVADEAIVHILNNAIASVRSGELRGRDDP